MENNSLKERPAYKETEESAVSLFDTLLKDSKYSFMGNKETLVDIAVEYIRDEDTSWENALKAYMEVLEYFIDKAYKAGFQDARLIYSR